MNSSPSLLITHRSLRVLLGSKSGQTTCFELPFRSGPTLWTSVEATFFYTICELGNYEFVLFGAVDSPLFDNGRVGAALDDTLKRAKDIGIWLECNSAKAR